MRPIAWLVALVGLACVATDAPAQCLGGKCGSKTVARSRTVTRSQTPTIGIYFAPRLAGEALPAPRAAAPTAEQVPTPSPTPATAAPTTAPASAAPATAAPSACRSKSVLKTRTTSRPVPVYIQPVWCVPPPMVWVPVYSCCPY